MWSSDVLASNIDIWSFVVSLIHMVLTFKMLMYVQYGNNENRQTRDTDA